MDRRTFLGGAGLALAGSVSAQAGPPGRWESRAALPLPSSEMARATAAEGRMHIVGGYGEGQVNRAACT